LGEAETALARETPAVGWDDLRISSAIADT